MVLLALSQRLHSYPSTPTTILHESCNFHYSFFCCRDCLTQILLSHVANLAITMANSEIQMFIERHCQHWAGSYIAIPVHPLLYFMNPVAFSCSSFCCRDQLTQNLAQNGITRMGEQFFCGLFCILPVFPVHLRVLYYPCWYLACYHYFIAC